MKTWKNYTSLVRNTILISLGKDKSLKYWRDDMFTNTIIYTIPLSFIALIPSLIWAYESKFYIMILVDILSLSTVVYIAIKKEMKIKKRKLLFIGMLYVLSSFIIYFVGINSTLYLLATCFLATFIYSFKNEYAPALLNLYISIIYITLYYFNLIPLHQVNFTITEVFAVFSNLIFLSFLVCSLIPKLFNGLDESFKNNMQHSQKIEKQNEVLKEITWVQSHVVRAPLSRIMAMTSLLKNYENNEEEKMFFIDNIIVSSDELDDVIKEIVVKSENICLKETDFEYKKPM